MNLVFKVFLLSLLVFSCAKPNYQEPAKITENQKPDPVTPNEPAKCHYFFQASHLCLSFKWLTQPKANEMASLTFNIYVQEKPTEFVDPKNEVNIQLWMPSMGHGSSPVTLVKTEAGRYKTENIYFVMPGEWEIRFQLKEEQSVIEQVVEKITVQ